MPKHKHPSIRAQYYVQYLAEGHTKRLSSLLAGYSMSTARNPGRAIQDQPGVLFLMYKTAGARAKIWGLEDGLEATKLVVSPVFKKTDQGYQKIRG